MSHGHPDPQWFLAQDHQQHLLAEAAAHRRAASLRRRARTRLLRRWRDRLADRRADREWAVALAGAVTPSLHHELLMIRDRGAAPAHPS